MEPQGPSQPGHTGANVFTNFAQPYFSIIDSGALYRKPFVILYTVLAGLNLLSILGVLGFMFKGGIALIITGLFMIFALWIGFQLWWDRRTKVNSFATPGSEFVALPVFSHLVQTMGEWTGTFVAIAGTGASLGGLIGSIGSGGGGGYGNPLAQFSNLGFAGLIACPIVGFLILILSRAIAEQIRALVAVANNTRNIERNTAR
ncbi:MAG: hypothetical protein U0V45_07835 [Flavobacteriales bacterium]